MSQDKKLFRPLFKAGERVVHVENGPGVVRMAPEKKVERKELSYLVLFDTGSQRLLVVHEEALELEADNPADFAAPVTQPEEVAV